jgi:hypothetical protein
MRRTLIALAFLVSTLSVFGNDQKTLPLKKINERVNIDGVIDPVWQHADSAADFVQYQPYHMKDPSRKTTAKVLTTDDVLYCLIICQDEKDNVQQNAGMLDQPGGDIVSIMLDTFLDKRTAYKFAVSAAGVRSDCRLLDDARNRDYSWDGVWFAASKVYDWGFVIEMEIPYRSIQYDETLTEWGLDFDRWIPASTEDIYWCPYVENEGQRISKFGKMVFRDFRPSVKGLNLEIYPVGIAKATRLRHDKYKIDPTAGLDIFYNPSRKLTFQLTGNPDFAQIEADPFNFNISRYESYFSERRPFFTEGNEVFMASGRERSSGFYRPLELFYSRRIGKKLADGTEVPLLLGTKAFGRFNEWEYGGFLAMTGEKEYEADGAKQQESQAYFASARLIRQVFENSSVGVLYVGKHTTEYDIGVIDIDGAFRASDWQLSYQVARSYLNSQGDFAMSAGLLMPKDNMIIAARTRYIGKDFDVDQVGFVPWKGTTELTALGGPRWYFNEGYVSQILIYAGGILNYERVDEYTDRSAVFGLNMQFRDNWGYEITLVTGKSKDQNKLYDSYEVDLSSWCNISPTWNANASAGYARTYNFSRDYLAFYSWINGNVDWRPLKLLSLGSATNVFVEGNPDNKIEDITLNTRPYFSLTPINDFNIRIYFDNVFVRSTQHLEQATFGFLLSFNFSPKSWVYLAINDVEDRSNEYDPSGNLLPPRMHVANRAGVLKIKYLYYF